MSFSRPVNVLAFCIASAWRWRAAARMVSRASSSLKESEFREAQARQQRRSDHRGGATAMEAGPLPHMRPARGVAQADAKGNILKGAHRALLCSYHHRLANAAMNTPEICAERDRLWRESVTLRLWCKGLIVESDNDWLRSPSLSTDVGAEPAKDGPKSAE
jgi:hypothetical protein